MRGGDARWLQRLLYRWGPSRDDVAWRGVGYLGLLAESWRQPGDDVPGERFLAEQWRDDDIAIAPDLRGVSAHEQRRDERLVAGHGDVDGQVVTLEAPCPLVVAGSAEDRDLVAIAVPYQLSLFIEVGDFFECHDRDGLGERGAGQRRGQQAVCCLSSGDAEFGQGDADSRAGQIGPLGATARVERMAGVRSACVWQAGEQASRRADHLAGNVGHSP